MNKNSTSLLPLNRNTASSKNELNPKVLQFGGGNFLRGFIDWMVETLNEQTDWNKRRQINFRKQIDYLYQSSVTPLQSMG